MSKFWSNLTKTLEPYVPGEQPKDKKYIKLNTNENPYPPSPKVAEVIKNFNSEELKLYPDPNSEPLLEAIANYNNLSKNEVFVGNGSDEILAFSFMAFFNRGEEIIYPDITYSFYKVYSKLFELKPVFVNLDDEFKIPVADLINRNRGMIFPNPNAPTGRYLESSYIEEILKSNRDKIVIVDEAYIDFGGESAIKFIKEYDNLLVIQTFSKSRSLAGSRLGFALGSKELIDGLRRVKDSFNSYPIDRIAMLSGIEAIKDVDYFEKSRNMIIETRERIIEKLEKLNFEIVPSKSNFVFIKHKEIKAKELFLKLREEGILVRYFEKDKIDDYLRVTIGKDEEMNSFIEKLKIIL